MKPNPTPHIDPKTEAESRRRIEEINTRSACLNYALNDKFAEAPLPAEQVVARARIYEAYIRGAPDQKSN